MSFEAALKELEDLGWDFRPYGVDAYGEAPEPTVAALDAYTAAMSKAMMLLSVDLPATASEQEIGAHLLSTTFKGYTLARAEEELKSIYGEIRKTRIKATAAVCGGSPTIEEMNRLFKAAPRILEAFLGWVAGWAADPTLGGRATKPSRVPSKNGASAS
jgi:hypothetical protein